MSRGQYAKFINNLASKLNVGIDAIDDNSSYDSMLDALYTLAKEKNLSAQDKIDMVAAARNIIANRNSYALKSPSVAALNSPISTSSQSINTMQSASGIPPTSIVAQQSNANAIASSNANAIASSNAATAKTIKPWGKWATGLGSTAGAIGGNIAGQQISKAFGGDKKDQALSGIVGGLLTHLEHALWVYAPKYLQHHRHADRYSRHPCPALCPE